MKYNIVLIIGIVGLEILILKMWLFCQRFADPFYYSALDIQLKVNAAISNDIGYSTFLVRFLHNKVYVSANELINSYIQFFDMQFVILFFSLIGVFGIVCGLYYLIKKENTLRIKLIFVTLVLVPVLIIFNKYSLVIIQVFVLWLPFQALSAYGVIQFIKNHRKSGIPIVLILFVVSIWYMLLMQKDYLMFCLK